LTYKELKQKDEAAFGRLNEAVLRAFIVKQLKPEGSSSIYHIFERLNNSGRKLSPQQIRVAIYHGFCIDLLHRLNDHVQWRAIYGRDSKTLKDEELILRFFGLHFFASNYSRPMNEFLNSSIEKLVVRGEAEARALEQLFTSTIDFIHDALGTTAFKPERAINAAVYDSVMVATAKRLAAAAPPDVTEFRNAYSELLRGEDYSNLVSQATADEANVSKRLKLATQAFIALGPAE
jgi:hypothetical protein